uniref:Dynamin-type G domain-containing protein n=1 Tax=Anopheles atroparvus TaxID=41427 RepID=A0AAG5CSQ4_ANOAO
MQRISVWVLLGLALFTLSASGLHVSAEAPTEYECRPYIEKAIQDLKTESAEVPDSNASTEDPIDVTSQEEDDNTAAEELSIEETDAAADDASEEITPSEEVQEQLFAENGDENAADSEPADDGEDDDDDDDDKEESDKVQVSEETGADQDEEATESEETVTESEEQADETNEEANASEEAELAASEEGEDSEDAPTVSEETASEESANQVLENSAEDDEDDEEDDEDEGEDDEAADATNEEPQSDEQLTESQEQPSSTEADEEGNGDSAEGAEEDEQSEEVTTTDSQEQEPAEEPSAEAVEESAEADSATAEGSEETAQEAVEESAEEQPESTEQTADSVEEQTVDEEVSEEEATLKADSAEGTSQEGEQVTEEASEETASEPKGESFPEEDLLLEYEIPTNLRDTSHIYELLNINDEASAREKALQDTADVILRDLKRIYDNSIKPLETLYKYRDLSNRHFGDPEIFSKPLVLFMGPWSGGKSTILNYLTHNEYTPNSVRTGAEPSPAYFNILMHGNEPEVLDGTQLAADWTFSGLQKFGQGLLDRLRGQRLPNKLLERVNIVEIPGILEVRKQVSKYFPFNDACQWFIDRADIIFLVYDPSKLDVGPETEAILDQLKGREYQTRILLNKADQVKPEELLRVQSALIWNISPLMSSAQPPVMYTVSLWSNPFEVGAPVRLLKAQERTLLLDLGQAIDKRIENKIASARRFAVRVRNHAKMVDCYLTTYYNQKSLFGNKKQTAEKIIASPQDYHIYEGLSTLTNISRYDLPDPEVYRDFFHLNPLYEFKKLSETCTYFRGCPINKLDVAIAYDLPELVGKYKKTAEAALAKLDVLTPTSDFSKGKSSS